jgi:hypothetical protein
LPQSTGIFDRKLEKIWEKLSSKVQFFSLDPDPVWAKMLSPYPDRNQSKSTTLIFWCVKILEKHRYRYLYYFLLKS